jgi:hypothetical protein
MARTKHLLILIESAESVQSRLKRLEDFVTFLVQNPDAKLLAVKVRSFIFGFSKLRSR